MKILKSVSAVLMAEIIALSSLAVPQNTLSVSADSSAIVALGADLTPEQKTMMLNYFGVDENSAVVIETTHSDEVKCLSQYVTMEMIGTRTLSCAYIKPASSGGIVVKTSNLSWVDSNMLANAVLTAGIENCQILATAPFEVSGTGALTGIIKAFETSEGSLDEEKKDVATQELIVTSDLTDEIKNEKIEEIIADTNNETTEENITDEISDICKAEAEKQVLALLKDLKEAALNGNLSEESAEKLVNDHLEEYKISVSEQIKAQLIDYVMSFSKVEYAKSYLSKLDELEERFKNGFNINFNVTVKFDDSLNDIQVTVKNINAWIQFLFGDIKAGTENIFDNVDTNMFDFDASSLSGIKDNITSKFEKNDESSEVQENTEEEPETDMEISDDQENTEE